MPYKDPEVRNRKARERYAANPKKYREKQYEWRRGNTDRWKQIQRKSSKGKPPQLLTEDQRRDVAEYQRTYRVEHFGRYTCSRLKRRAKALGVPFNLEPSDIIVPSRCPVFGVKLTFGGSGQRDDAPSVDRLVPDEGYVKGNVRIISMKANRIKNDASIEELKLVLEDLRRIHGGG